MAVTTVLTFFSSTLVLPYWSKRDLGAWSIPKGEMDDKEDAEKAARREFAEELGVPVHGPLQPLGCIRQRASKIGHGYALEGNLEVSSICSNHATIEWPPRSGRIIAFPEIDRAALPGRRFSQVNGRSSIVLKTSAGRDHCRTVRRTRNDITSTALNFSDAKATLACRSNNFMRELIANVAANSGCCALPRAMFIA